MYSPVNTMCDTKAFTSYNAGLTNALTPVAESKICEIKEKTVITDSGGLQINTLGLNNGKSILLGSMYENRINDPDSMSIGVFANCMEYRRVGSAIAFCVDIPPSADDSEYEYYYKLREAIEARDQMLSIAQSVCPDTKMGIVLHPRQASDIEQCFSLNATLKTTIYAYPARNTAKDAIDNAYILSFLHSMGVKHVHFLGSSAVPIIMILAKAIELDMFDSLSFDSLTWNQPAVRQGYRYLSPETLQSLPKEKSLRPDQNLLWVLREHKDFLRGFKKRFNPPEFMLVKNWLGIVNIMAIEYFKNKLLSNRYEMFPDDKLNPDIVFAMDMLHQSKFFGHEDMKQRYYMPRINSLN